jgi:hypothetical protein
MGIWDGIAGYFEAMDYLLRFLLWVCVIFIPLGLWKFIEILIWFCHHIHWG